MKDTIDDIDTGGEDAALRLALRQLRRDTMPGRDLWPQIQSRIATTRREGRGARRPARRFVPWALAASVLLAVTIAWQTRPQPQHSAQARLISQEAQAMTREYRGALQVIAKSAPASADADPALHELDRSAAQIRGALAKDPDARFLLDRLRRTYAMRLALTQRAALS
jgi:hypothetical protein